MIGPAVGAYFWILWEIFPKRSTERLQGVQWCIAKNRGGYTLEMRHRRCRASSAEGARIEAPKAPRGWGFFREGVSPSPAD